jgi:hypothetical protein
MVADVLVTTFQIGPTNGESNASVADAIQDGGAAGEVLACPRRDARDDGCPVLHQRQDVVEAGIELLSDSAAVESADRLLKLTAMVVQLVVAACV